MLQEDDTAKERCVPQFPFLNKGVQLSGLGAFEQWCCTAVSGTRRFGRLFPRSGQESSLQTDFLTSLGTPPQPHVRLYLGSPWPGTPLGQGTSRVLLRMIPRAAPRNYCCQTPSLSDSNWPLLFCSGFLLPSAAVDFQYAGEGYCKGSSGAVPKHLVGSVGYTSPFKRTDCEAYCASAPDNKCAGYAWKGFTNTYRINTCYLYGPNLKTSDVRPIPGGVLGGWKSARATSGTAPIVGGAGDTGTKVLCYKSLAGTSYALFAKMRQPYQLCPAATFILSVRISQGPLSLGPLYEIYLASGASS